MNRSPLYLTEADVARLVTVGDAIAVLEQAFATWHDVGTTNLTRQRAPLATGNFNLMGASYGPTVTAAIAVVTVLSGVVSTPAFAKIDCARLNHLIDIQYEKLRAAGWR